MSPPNPYNLGSGNPAGFIQAAQEQEARTSSVLSFPKDMPKHHMLFSFFEYRYGEAGDPRGNVILPLPANGIKENSDIQVNEIDLGLAGSSLAQGAQGFGDRLSESGEMRGGVDGFWSEFGLGSGESPDLESVLRGAAGGAEYIGRGTLSTATAGAFDVGVGATLNKYTTLSFQNVSLRTHNFSWKFFPTEEEESQILTQVKTLFQTAAHPEFTGGLSNGGGGAGKILMKYPWLVQPQILISAAESYYLKYNLCMIQNVSFSLGEGGNFLMRGGAPASVSMNVTMKEVKIVTKEHYGG